MQFIADNVLLITLALVSGALLVWPTIRSRTAGPALTTLQATQLINQKAAQVVDVRQAEEFSKGSVPGAKNFPADSALLRAAELKKDKPLILVDERGVHAGRLATRLRAAGFAQVFVLNGGLSAWRQAGLPLRS